MDESIDEKMKGMLAICDAALKFDHINIGILEHIMIVLCLGMRTNPDQALELLKTILNGKYCQFASNFLFDFLSNSNLLEIKFYMTEAPSAGSEVNYKLSYRITTNTISFIVKSYLTALSESKFKTIDKPEVFMKECKDEVILAGSMISAVFLL